MDEEKRKEFRGHVALYAKGHYMCYYNPIDDLLTIAKKTGFEDNELLGWEVIFRELVDMTHYAFLQLGSETHEVPNLSTTPHLEFVDFVSFLHNNCEEVVEKYGVNIIQAHNMDTPDLARLQHRLLEYQLVQGLLVTIAKWKPQDDELGEPSMDILPLRSPPINRGGKKK